MLPRSAKLSRQPAGSGPHSRKSLKRATPASKGAVSGPARRGGAGAKPLPSGSDGGRTSGEGPDEWVSGGRWEAVGVAANIAGGGAGVRVCVRGLRGAGGRPGSTRLATHSCGVSEAGLSEGSIKRTTGCCTNCPAPARSRGHTSWGRAGALRAQWHRRTFADMDAARLAKQPQRCLRRAHRHEPFEEGE